MDTNHSYTIHNSTPCHWNNYNTGVLYIADLLWTFLKVQISKAVLLKLSKHISWIIHVIYNDKFINVITIKSPFQYYNGRFYFEKQNDSDNTMFFFFFLLTIKQTLCSHTDNYLDLVINAI